MYQNLRVQIQNKIKFDYFFPMWCNHNDCFNTLKYWQIWIICNRKYIFGRKILYLMVQNSMNTDMTARPKHPVRGKPTARHTINSSHALTHIPEHSAKNVWPGPRNIHFWLGVRSEISVRSKPNSFHWLPPAASEWPHIPTAISFRDKMPRSGKCVRAASKLNHSQSFSIRVKSLHALLLPPH